MLLPPALRWARVPAAELTIPQSPIEATNSRLHEEWMFLREAAAFVPPGARYTVLASDLHREMTLYMMSIGLFRGTLPVPASYHGGPLSPSERGEADLVLSYRCEKRPPEGFRLERSLPGGCLWKRRTVR